MTAPLTGLQHARLRVLVGDLAPTRPTVAADLRQVLVLADSLRLEVVEADQHTEDAERIVEALAAADPRGIWGLKRPYCVLCGAHRRADDLHATDCPWRLAVEHTNPVRGDLLARVFWPDEEAPDAAG